MGRDAEKKVALENLSRAVKSEILRSVTVRAAIERLRELGFEAGLSIRLEIAQEDGVKPPEAGIETTDLQLTPEDIRTLRRMRIRT